MLTKLNLNSNYIDTYHNLLTMDWFANCGTTTNTDFDFYIKVTDNLEEAVKSINTVGWQNVCINNTFELDKEGHKEGSVSWTELFESLQKEYFVLLEKQLLECTNKMELPRVFKTNIMTNMIHIFKFDDDHGLENSRFFLKMIKVYESGHIPCKWVGDHETGGFLIY